MTVDNQNTKKENYKIRVRKNYRNIL